MNGFVRAATSYSDYTQATGSRRVESEAAAAIIRRRTLLPSFWSSGVSCENSNQEEVEVWKEPSWRLNEKLGV